MSKLANTEPDWPTMVRGRLSGGRFLAIDRSVWVYRKVPMSPVVDAKTSQAAIAAGAPLAYAYEEVAGLAVTRGKRRSLARSSYRQTHLMLVNVPRLFEPEPSPIDAYLREQFPTTVVDSRLLIFGVKLQASVGSGGMKSAVNSVVETMVSGGTPLSDYDRDYQQVSEALDRSGLRELTPADIRLADAWWNHGRFPDTPTLNHADHMHVFASAEATAVAKQFGADNCKTWGDIGGHHILTFAAVQDFELPYVPASDATAKWVSPLVNSGAAVVSIRAAVEPSKITREELRRQRKGYTDDVTQRMREGKMDRAEHDQKLQELADVEAIYADGNGPVTLVDTSVIVGFDGYVEDLTLVAGNQLTLSSMLFRQPRAWAETMIGSHFRANPHLHDLPVPAVAYSAIPSLSNVGDREGALVGFTEHDRQPVLLSPTAVANEDTYPIAVVAASSGAGKSLMMLWLADQFARMGRPVVIIDPKTGSSHDAAVKASGGQVASLDNLLSSDGVLDPLRFAGNKEVGIELAASMLLTINPWGDQKLNYEVPLIAALTHGVGRGATCIGQALTIAVQEGQAPREMVEKVFALANGSAMFRALFGVNPATEGLRLSAGITLIKVGDAHLDLPKPNTPIEQTNLFQRVALCVVRMMIFGSAMALTGRDGVILQDEAWTILNADPGEVERLGRLARSQRVLPILLSQDISGAVRAGLSGFISRGFIGPIGDEEEAIAACKLFRVEPTPERLARITAKASIGAIGEEQTAPNWESMKSLRDPATRKVLRGSVWLHSDLAGRVVPVECTIPEAFLRLASTNAADIDSRGAVAAV